MKKRIISMLLVLCMVLALAPAGLTNAQASENRSQQVLEGSSKILQPSAGAGNTATQEPVWTGGIINRAQWVQDLVKTFDMTVEESHAPDNYFSDLTGEESYYRDILVAVQFGVLDIPVGEAFHPNDAATREFAAQTLNSCLGFMLNENESYTFSEAGSVTYPDAIQIAIDRGWFALSGKNFLPQQAITDAEEKAMLVDAEQTLSSRVINASYKNSYAFSTNVIEVPQGTDVEIAQDTVTIRNNPKAINNGDVFIVWYNGIPCAYIANDVLTSGDEMTVHVTAVEDDSAIVSADAQGVLGTEFVQFVPAEGTEVVYVDEVTGTEYADARQADAAIASHHAKRGTKKLMTLQLKSEITLGSGMSASVSVKLKDPVLEYKISSKSKTAYVTLTADYEFSISAKAELIENVAVKKLRLGFWGCPGIGGIELAMVYSLAGSLTGTYTGTMCVGVDYTSGAGFSMPRSFRSKGFSLVIEASLKAGLQVNLGINDIPADVLSGNVYAEVGAKGSVKRTSYNDDTTPTACVQTAMYLYLECGARLTFKVGSYKSEYSREYKIWKDSNSPVRVVHHYEDGKEVCACTRGNVYDNGYYTVGRSNYWGSGWSGGTGGSGYDRYGNPVPVYTYTVDEEGNATITGYNGGGASVAIPETIDGYTVTEIGEGAFKNNSSIQAVSLPNTVKRIEKSAFEKCINLSNVMLSSNTTYIGGFAFGYCNSLEYISIPQKLAAVGECTSPIGYTIPWGGPFAYCSSLRTVSIEEGMTKIPEYLFYKCIGLKAITIPGSVTSVGQSAFQECANLISVEIPDSVTFLGGYAFGYCTGLTSINIPNSLTSVGNCTSNLGKLYIPYGGPFAYCSNLEYASIAEGATCVPDCLFFRCTGLKSIAIPNSVKSIGSSAFQECTNLCSAKIPDSITFIGGYAFGYCTGLTSINIPNSLTSAGDSTFNFDKLYIPYGGPFAYCSSLQTVFFDEGITLIPSFLFYKCTGIQSITLPNSIESIGEKGFSGCSSLERIILPETIKEISNNSLSDCIRLESIRIPGGTKIIGNKAFQNCTSLTSIEIPDSITSVGSHIFDGCAALKDVKLGGGLTKLPERAFSNCSELESIVIPYRVEEIGANAFLNDVKLTAVTIPRRTEKIASNAFSYPDKLTIYGVAGTYAEAYAGEIGAAFVAIDKPAASVMLSETAVNMNKSATIQLTATVAPADFTDETAWKSSDASVATVTDAGIVKAVGVGECTISFAAGNVKATCNITVVQPVTGISLNKTSVSLEAGQTCQLTATVYPADAANRAVEWSSSDESVASVSTDGLVTARKKGTATITATAKDGSGSARSCTVTVLGNLIVCSTVEELQSPHPYAANCNDVWLYTIPGAANLLVTFSAETSVESGSDYLYLYGADGTQIGKYTGAELAGKTVTIPGDTVRIKLVSDRTYCEYGFAVTNITTQSEPHTHSYSDTVTAPNCTEQGYTTHTCSCGESYVDSYVHALGHTWDSGVVTKQPSQTEQGEKTYTCARCGATRTESIPAAGGQTDKTCDGGADCTSRKFVDVSAKDWFHGAVDFAVEQGLFGGMSANTFEPDTPMTRAMLVTVLWRYEGKPGAPASTFTDVKTGTWYTDAVSWASANGVVNGVGNNEFDPEGDITREQMATILYRYCNGKGIDTSEQGSLSGFPDAEKVSSYAQTAMQWTVVEGIIGGSDGKLLPQGSATRAQVATILMRFIENTD